MFDKNGLSLEKIQYNKNEMLIYESELDQTTLNTLKSSEKQKQLRKNIYDINPDLKTTQIKTIYNAEDFKSKNYRNLIVTVIIIILFTCIISLAYWK